MFRDPSPQVRAGAAKALWGSTNPDDGRALLHAAIGDPSPMVRGASFSNFFWAAHADITSSHDLAAYDAAVNAALRSPDAEVVGGALIARASLHGIGVDAATRPFAFDRRPLVRQRAIDSYDYMMAYNRSIECFIESRLRDPSPDVRSSVLLRLFRMGDHHARPEIEALARTAPTRDERQEATDYLRGLRHQHSLAEPSHC